MFDTLHHWTYANIKMCQTCQNISVEIQILFLQKISRAHFDQFITFVVDSYIMGPDPIFRMALFYEIYCWNQISDCHTVLNPYDLTCC